VKAAARDALHSWLSAGTGIFHISGKLGSGKSTLMKYLCGHPSTKALLNEWAGKNPMHAREPMIDLKF
jgi:ABC-type hemin transport system ATPase subunit